MSVATMTSKGQITVPIDVRKELKIEAGSKIEFIPDGEGAFRIVPKRLSVMDLLGSISANGKAVSVEEMNDVIAAEALKGYTAFDVRDEK